MKKSVKSKADLNKLALSAGATVTGSSGQKFNTSKKKAVARPRLEKNPDAKPIPPKPAPEAPPAPVVPDQGEVARAIESAGKAHVMMLAELKSQMAAIQINEGGRPTEWIFDMIRDDKGYLTRIVATAGRNETFN